MKYEFEVEGTIIGKERPRLNTYTGIIYTPRTYKRLWIASTTVI